MYSIHNDIREDLIANQGDLLNLQYHYTHKYRSQERFVDIHVGIFQDNIHYSTVQIYVSTKEGKIKEKFRINKHDKVLYNSEIQIKTSLIKLN